MLPGSRILFPKTLKIPQDIKNARVMSYGYSSVVAFSKSTAGVEEFARDLLERLKAVRLEATRPIIFICHSMGGLIVKKVKVHAGVILDTDPETAC